MPAPIQRGGVTSPRPNQRLAKAAAATAKRWAGKTLAVQARSELVKAQASLLACGVTPDAPGFDPAARLLANLNEFLENHAV